MAKKKNVNKRRNTELKSNYKNPDETLWGKIILWILVVGFAGLIVAGAIVMIIQSFN